ncbi:MAG: DNA translocase FtsK 4TM domain-containing protein [Bdellovibrionaceae bacterium]|nr:DNA translocase FtsK 4TM domain-containing protein [Pseudobdellovibrionaceae bacterium]
MQALFKKFQKDIRAILFIGISVFIALALFSYNPKDPSFNSMGSKLSPTNYCGWLGSFLSDLFYQGLGISAWLVAFAFLKLGLNTLRGQDVKLRSLNVVWLTLLIVNVSALTAFYFPQAKLFGHEISISGIIGLSVSNILFKLLNFAGLQIFLWSNLIILVLFYTEKSLQQWGVMAKNQSSGFVGVFITLKKWLAWPVIAERAKEKRAKSEKSSKPVDVAPEVENLKDWKVKSDEISRLTQLNFFEEEPESETTIPAKNELDHMPKRKVILKAKPPKKIENWDMPKLNLLEDPPLSRVKIDEKEIRKKAEILTDKLKNFSVEGTITDAKPGPLVTMFEFKPNADVKLSKITELQDDLALALSSESLRVIAPIPGRDVVGIETSNSKRETVYYKDLLAEDDFWSEDLKLPIALGRQVNGDPKIVDLRKMPHLMVAGTTGSGKSVLITSIISGLLFRHSPKTLRLILVDPKQVDLAAFSKVPHLIMPPVTDPKKAVSALKWAIREMEKRYKSMSKFGARGLESFNETVAAMTADKVAEHEKINQEYETQGVMKLEQYYYQPLPYIVIVVEEFGDLMAVDKQNVEQGVVRLAQMARACGIHLILAMQSPRKEVVTGLIKTNIPGRVGLKVAAKMDSRIILDEGGAERLLPNGDMLFLAPGVSKPMRHHGPYLSEKEINGLASHWANQAEPEFDPIAVKALEGFGDGTSGADEFGGGGGGDEDYDEMYDQILAWAAEQKEVSASLIQRRFRLGYPRAARIIETFEREGVVGPANGSKPRSVLINAMPE